MQQYTYYFPRIKFENLNFRIFEFYNYETVLVRIGDRELGSEKKKRKISSQISTRKERSYTGTAHFAVNSSNPNSNTVDCHIKVSLLSFTTVFIVYHPTFAVRMIERGQ
jgi:hypothetical protein